MLLYNKKLSSKDESNKSYHLSSRIPAGFGTVFHWKGCRSFTGPVPPLLMMNFLKFAVMRCIRIKMGIYYALYLKMSILTYRYYKI